MNKHQEYQLINSYKTILKLLTLFITIAESTSIHHTIHSSSSSSSSSSSISSRDGVIPVSLNSSTIHELTHNNSQQAEVRKIKQHISAKHVQHEAFNFNKPPKPCFESDDCNPRRGESCRYLYEGCNIGQCMCQADLGRDNVAERCHDNEKRYLNGSCSMDLDCTGGMQCRGGLCRCSLGGLPTDDGSFCLLERRHRLIGSPCNPALHSCLQRAIHGYTSYDVECDAKTSVCSCVNGFKTEGITCSRRNVGETGCYRSYNCDGGSICVDQTCRCPTGYHVPRSYDKCIKKGAITNLELGSPCDEINEKSYCSQHLICYRCHASLSHKCVRYINISKFSPLTSCHVSCKPEIIPFIAIIIITSDII